MPGFESFSFPSSTGKNTIHALCCLPDGEVRGVVHLAHGIAEYIDRYRPFMQFLAEHGFVAVGNDHLGHGKSIASPEEQGIFDEADGWQRVLDDMARLHALTVEKHPDVPYIFFGHSMGSFLTRHYVILHPGQPKLVILCGTGHQNPLLVAGGYTMARLAVRRYGPRHMGDKLNQLAFGAYTKGIENVRTPYDWLNRDSAEVDKYAADPLCGFVPSVSLFRDMMGGIQFITSQKNIDQMNKKTPVLLISGGADPVGENGKGVQRAYRAFLKAGLHDVMMKLYPGARHEILLELNHEEVFSDILKWMENRLN